MEWEVKEGLGTDRWKKTESKAGRAEMRERREGMGEESRAGAVEKENSETWWNQQGERWECGRPSNIHGTVVLC